VNSPGPRQATTSGWTALLARTAPALCEMAVAQARALSLSSRDQHLSARQSWAILAFHLCGLLAIIRLSHQAFWIGLAPLFLLLPLAASFKLKRLYLFPESLAPFAVTYVVIGLRLLIAVIARAQGFVADSLIVPDPWGGLLNMDLAITISGVWALVAQAGPTLQAFGKRIHWAAVLGYLLLSVALIWSALTYFNLRTSGVTASDPYAYVQMAVDLAQHRTLLHTFDLVPSATGWRLTLWPLVPIGYRSPNPASGTAATVWPPGYSAFLAIAYWLMGEPGLYLLTPLLGLATLLALWFLCQEVLHHWPSALRFLAAGLAVLILATSYQQIDRLVVPMADIPAQLFSTLAVLLALRGARKQSLLSLCLSGLCLGIAFAIRYTQVLLAASVLTAVWVYLPRRPRLGSELLRLLAWVGVGAGLAALPVFWYHQVAFGNPFGVGSSELALLGWAHIPATFARVSGELFQTNEFLWLIPFAAWGAYRLGRNSSEASLALLAWLLVTVLFHVLYQALRLRDLLSIFPVLALAAGVGMAELLAGSWAALPSEGEGAAVPAPRRGEGRAAPAQTPGAGAGCGSTVGPHRDHLATAGLYGFLYLRLFVPRATGGF
jgi:hypothetical protein